MCPFWPSKPSPVPRGVTGKDWGRWLSDWAVESRQLFGPACGWSGGREGVLNKQDGAHPKVGGSNSKIIPITRAEIRWDLLDSDPWNKIQMFSPY